LEHSENKKSGVNNRLPTFRSRQATFHSTNEVTPLSGRSACDAVRKNDWRSLKVVSQRNAMILFSKQIYNNYMMFYK